ncbi:basement membrane-specific heparan sulfate proteoglycan core protein isoform X2 [Pleurodeles waltl]|uniref:basement membrane-specific heparan sulfate proteoglycan core protein isoform X2 n=1 Tax=Pleurodeles waltl TaxID=8319 RepID=UPI0037093C11
MGHRKVLAWLQGPLLCLLLLAHITHLAQASKVLDEVTFPDDAESDRHSAKTKWGDLSDDEDLLADEASGDDNGSAEIGSGTPAPMKEVTQTSPVQSLMHTVYYRALVNFTNSIEFTPDLENASSEEFREVSEAVVDTLESEYYKIPGEQIVSVVFIKEIDGYVFVELDVGSEGNSNSEQIRKVLYSVIESSSIGSYITSVTGFQFRRLGAVTPEVRQCTSSEFTCRSGECIPAEYRCDRRTDCRDLSDEDGCEVVGQCSSDEFTCGSGECVPQDYRCDYRPDCRDQSDEDGCVFPTTPRIRTIPPVPPTRPPYVPVTTFAPATTTRRVPATTPPRRTTPKPPIDVGPRQCLREEARCPNGQCIPRDYLCDGERDCKDGSDELNCGTPSPCEPNEFKCQNGRCALKIWRCDGDDDCGDRSDEYNCPTKGPQDTCAPDQFICVSSRTCIPASYQCDDEADCEDRSDEFGCRPPQVITPPEESISASRGETVRFTCVAVGVPIPIITWRLNWGHIPTTSRVSMTSESGHGTLVIRDVKEADQGAYTCEAINTKGMVFGIPDGVLVLKPNRGPCPDGQFHIAVSSRCIPCFCFGVTRVCQNTGRYRNQIRLRFDVPDDFKGTNVSVPSHVGAPLLSSNQLLIDPNLEEFQLVDLSRRFLSYDSFWTLPPQFLGNKVDSYGGSLSFKVQYVLTRGQSEPVQKPDVVISGNGRKLVSVVQGPTRPAIVNQRRVHFTEEHWRHESGAPVTREDLLMTLQNLDSIMIQTVHDNKMASVGLSDVVMDTTTVEFTSLGVAHGVEECRCPAGYSGLSCEICAPQFDRVPGGPFLGTCSGCNCNGHASSCDSVTGYCLNCQHNTEGPQCNQCKAGFFGDPTRGTSDACRSCACPYIDPRRRFSDTCFLDSDGQATCDACVAGYTGRRCEKCAAGYEGDPMQPGGKCQDNSLRRCDERGSASSSSQACLCKPNVEGTLCDVCKNGAFFLSEKNTDGCLKCFCMGVTKQCASSFWNRDQVRAAHDSSERALFSLANIANTRTISQGIAVGGQSELMFGAFASVPRDTYFWVLPERFKGDKVTSYGGELKYTIIYDESPGSRALFSKPDVILQGNGIFLEHFSSVEFTPGTPTTVTVLFREHAWQRADGQAATREHLLMALADIDLFMIRASYSDRMLESRISNIHMDVAVPHSTGFQRAVEVENCVCPIGYTGPSCQDCDVGYTRSTSGLYLGTCERCDCSGHAADCDVETGECQNCQHHTEGPKCDRCQPGYYGHPRRGSPGDCQPCPCPSSAPSSQPIGTCSLGTDGRPTCDSCPTGYIGRQCERCAPGYVGDPSRGQVCRQSSGTECRCDPHGSLSSQCDARGQCHCKPNVEGVTCGSCRAHHFHLSGDNQEGCLPCFCMGVTQLCTSSSYHRDLVTSPFLPGNFQDFALVNRQHSTRITTGFTVEMSSDGPHLSYNQFGQLGQESYFWQLPDSYQGDKVGSYGGRLQYTLSYNAGIRGSPLPDADIQITGNDIMLVAFQPELRPREPRNFEITFREQYWKRPDGQPATREHLMMVLADLDEILIRATYSSDMISASITGVSMEVAVPSYTNLDRAIEVEQCQCPPGYSGLSCQDCAVGFTRTGGGLYLGHCEMCECNGHSESCHPETGACSNCLHNTVGEFCDQCAPGYYGDATAGTPEDCQPCACPLTDPENQFSRTCESLGAEGYRCTACQPGYTGQYCERCAPGYSGNPNIRGQKCVPSDRAPFIVQVHPPKATVFPGGEVSLRCHVSGSPPYYFYWSREDGRPVPSNAQPRARGEELHFRSIQPSDAGVYICTCRNLQSANTSRAELIVAAPTKPITVTVEEPKGQNVRVGSDVTFICTAKSKSPAYTLAWTRQNNDKLPERAMDFNGILTIRNVHLSDAGVYICTGSNMFDMDEGTATLYVQESSKSQMFFGPFETFEGHRPSSAAVPPSAVIEPLQLSVQQGQAAEFHCIGTGSPAPSLEWTGGQSGVISSKAIIQGGILRFPAVEPSDEGHYTCRVHNSAGQHFARAVLRVHSGIIPVVQVSPERIEVQEGDTVSLYCRAGGSPAAIISWKKLGGTLPSKALSSFGFLHFRNSSLEALHRRIQELQSRVERKDISTLVIPSVTTADGGTYICVGTSSSRSAEARIEVIVHRASAVAAPVRIEPSSNAVTEGQTVELNCLVSGPPPHTVTWHRPAGVLSSNHQVSGTRMRIIHATLADSGEYLCRVISSSGVQQASILVTITPASGPSYPSGISPTIRIEPVSNANAEGQTVELNCVVIGQLQPTVVWYRPGRSLSPNHQVSGSRLRILDASVADSGEYICRVSSGSGVQQASITVSIGSSSQSPSIPAPVRIESPSETFVEGQTVDLNCIVAGQKRSTVTWHRSGGSLPFNHQVSGSRLRIPQASPDDSGEYICRSSSGSGFHQASITISIVSSSQNSAVAPPVRIELSHESIVEGQTVDLNCIVAGQYQPEVTWHRASGSLPSNHQVSGPHLRILQATPADSGIYICRTSSGSIIHESSINLSITGSSQNPGIIPPLRIESSHESVVEGQTVELNCIVSGQLRPAVTWHRAGQPLSPNHQVLGSRLRILQASPADSGEYICRAVSSLGTQQASVIVSITSPNQESGFVRGVRIESSSETVVEGQNVELNCIVTGQSTPTITWHRAGGALASNHQVLGSRLRILQASPADSGEYICRVSSGAGVQKASVMVSITAGSYRLQSPIISIDPHSGTVGPGEDVTFRCRIQDGAQPIHIEWKMAHNQPLQDNVQISPDGSIITITRARHSNQGAYRCVASNIYGIANSVVNLIVQGPPTVSVNPKGPIKVKVGESINLECMGIGDPHPVVSWRRTSARPNTKQEALAHLDSNAVLQILSARPEDAGSYSCIARNTYGSVQVQVEVHVEGRIVNPAAPSVTPVEAAVIVVSGGTATLRCSAEGTPTPSITWSKLRAPLPWQHQVVNNTLIIPRVAQQDSGQYICNASSPAGYSEAFIALDVETPPYATSLPDEVSVRLGDMIQLQCLAHGTPPLRFRWAKVNGTLSEKATIQDGVLHINEATAEDAGKYRCHVTNKVGAADTFALVSIQTPLIVRITPQIDVKGIGGTAQFNCAFGGVSEARIEWFKDGGQLSPDHSVRNGVLRIPNLNRASEGVYTCRVISFSGQAQDSAKLVIQALPKVMINVRTSVQTVLAGNAVEFECLAIGDPQPSVTWSKVGSRMPSDVVIQGGMLKLEQVKQSDAGQYRCTATNDVGTVHSQVILHVQSVPQIAAQPEVKEITTGSTAVFPCMASGFPVPNITWTKLEGDLPKEATIEDNVMTIPSVRLEHAGTYVCTAANRQGRVTAFSMLKVRERVMPYFTNNPQSYLPLPTIKDAYKNFEIQITFRPDTADGMLVYNGQKKNTGGDFISFGLVGGRPELRFDAGSGMATIRYPTPLKIGEFHTVTLFRNLTQGALAVDNYPPVNGTSQGKFQGLDLNEKLYLGGYPDYEMVAKTGLKSGFVGCVRQLIIQGEEVIFKDFDLSIQGISNCPTCKDRPCQNRGVCQDSESSSYKCICPRGFTGSNCEHSQALHCHAEACGPDATCVNRPDGQGYSCRCHLGKSGDKCMTGVMVTTPSFNGEDSFISYPPLTNIHYELRVDMEFKSFSPNGLLFFSGGKPAPREDFVSLAMVNGYMEFRYELGSGQAILRSAEPLVLGHWHKISAERMNKDGTLQVDTSKPIKRSSPGKSQGLNLHTAMFLGGIDQSVTVPAAANISSRFHGCIGEVSVNGKKVDISYSFLESHGISQCYDRSPCDRMPCLHGGRCMPAGEYEFQCLCPDGFKGDRCETKVNQCLPGGHCSNGGTCEDHHCICPPSFTGTHCEQGTAAVYLDAEWHEEGSGGNDAPGQYGSFFSDDAYIALPRQMFPRSRPEAPETIELEVRTTSSSGVILWQGVEEKEHGKAKDFISIGLKDGHLVFSYQLGSGEANIVSEDPVNDGEWHKVTAIREGKEGSIQVDGEEMVTGQSPGKNIMVNTKGSIYLGGAPNMKTLTAGKYSSGITGCIKNVVLMNARPGPNPHQPIDLKHHVEAGQNTQECPS